MAANGSDLLNRCQQASNEAVGKSNDLKNYIANSKTQLLGASNEFFKDLLDLAKAIGGDYDKTALTPPVRQQTSSKLDALIAGGEKIAAIADDAEKHVDTTDQQIANIVDSQLVPTLNEAKQLQASLTAQVGSARDQVTTLQRAADQAQQTANAAQQELNNAQNQLSQEQAKATAANIGVKIGLGPFGSFTPIGVLLDNTLLKSLNDNANSARNRLNNAAVNLTSSVMAVNGARGRQAAAEQNLRMINSALAMMPSLVSTADATRQSCEQLRDPIIALKKQQDQLGEILSDMQNAAVTAKLDTRKKALGRDILQVISIGLIDNDDPKKSITEGLAQQLQDLDAKETAVNAAQLHLTAP